MIAGYSNESVQAESREPHPQMLYLCVNRKPDRHFLGGVNTTSECEVPSSRVTRRTLLRPVARFPVDATA